MFSSRAQEVMYQSNTDYTPMMDGLTSLCLILATFAIIGRCSARWVGGIDIGPDDILCMIAYVALVGNIIGNFLISSTKSISLTPPTQDQLAMLTPTIFSIGYTYPVSVLCSKLSLLFLYRRIFGMRVMWFRICWWFIFIIMCPCCIAASIIFTSLQVAEGSLNTSGGSGKYLIPLTAIVNAFTDLVVLMLPIGMTVSLQMNWKKRLGLIGIFSLGALGSAVSFFRAGQSIVVLHQTWDSRYQLFHDAVVGLAEATVIEICACLPVMRPLFRKFASATAESFTSLTTRTSSNIRSQQKASAMSLHSQERRDDDIPLKDGVIHRRMDYVVDRYSLRDESSVNKVYQDLRLGI